MTRSFEYVRKAIAIDPSYAEAHAVLGVLSYAQALLGLQPAADVVPAAKESLLAALTLDASLPEAHAILGSLAAMYDYDLAEAARRFALSRMRESIGITGYMRDTSEAAFLSYTGRAEEAVDLLRRVLSQDPVNPVLLGTFGNACAAAARYEEAVTQYRNALELNDRAWVAYEGLTMVYAFEGRFDEALVTAEKAHVMAPWNTTGVGMFAGCLRRVGDVRRSDQTLALFGDGARFGAPIGFAIYHAINGNSDTGAEWLEKAIEQRDPRVTVFLSLSSGRVWRRSARWPTLAKTLGLSPLV